MNKKTQDYSYAVFPSGRTFSAALESAGARVFTIPAPEIQAVQLTKSEGAIIKKITEFDWIIFPDVLAVGYFVEALEKYGVDPFELDLVRVCSLGEIVSDRLRFSSLHSDIITGSNQSREVFRAIREYVAGEAEISQLTFVIPKEDSENLDLVKLLKNSGAEVLEIPIYRINPVVNLETARIKALLKGGAIDEIIFTTAEDLISLKNLLTVPDWSEALNGIKISATDEPLLQFLLENGFAAQAANPKPKI